MTTHRFFVSDFVEIQRKSFLKLLGNGLLEEFAKRNPITNGKKNLELFFYPHYYKLTPPQYTPRECILRSKSYSAKLYLPVQLTDKLSQLIKLKWVCIGNLPLMTKRGHFILNGISRVIVNQMIRSPGIYYQTKIYENYITKWSSKTETTYKRYYADLICQRGAWLRIEVDKEKLIWAQLKKGPKIPLFWFLISMGLTEKIIFKSILDARRLLLNFQIASPSQSSHSSSSCKAKKKNQFTKNYGPKITGGKLGGHNFNYVKKPSDAWANIYFLFFPETKIKLRRNTNKFKPFEALNSVPPKSLFSSFRTSSASLLNKEAEDEEQEKYVESKILVKKSQTISELGRKWIFNKFMNPRTYDLGYQGRLSINKKFGLSVKKTQCTLTPQDLLFATDYLLKIEKGLKNVDDIDNLKNRRVRTSGELLQIQIGTGIVRLEKIIREKMNQISTHFQFHLASQKTPLAGQSFVPTVLPYSVRRQNTKKEKDRSTQLSTLSLSQQSGVLNKNETPKKKEAFIRKRTPKLTINELINTKAFNGVIQEFFGSSPLSQFMDQINPLSELTHKRRLSSMGPGGVTRDNATLAIRGIHPTHYGRICPVETPEGKNTGLVNSITTYARVNPQGLIETPFYKVYKGQVQKKTGMFFFSAEQEEKIKLAAADLSISKIGFLPKSNIPVRISEDFTKISRHSVQYIGVSPVQMISIATSLIPFLEHDDANRALMGSNMQRQAVPLIRPERPLVGTGLEARVISDSGHAVQAKNSGFISYVSAQKIIIFCSPFL